jgi:hypothetical protein
MKKVVLTSLLAYCLLIALSGCAQKFGIAHAKAFVRESHRGTQRVDDNNQSMGAELIRENIIFVETAAGKPAPAFKLAWVDGKPYSVNTIAAEPATVFGKMKDEDREASMAVAEGNKLWQLVLSESPSTRADSSISAAIRSNPVVLTGTWKGKPFTYKISKRSQLEPIMYQ